MNDYNPRMILIVVLIGLLFPDVFSSIGDALPGIFAN